MDWFLAAAIILSFALFVTVHFSLAVGLARRAPRWRGPLALLVPPLAPYWGYSSGMRGRTALWGICLGAYALSLAGSYLFGGP